MILYMKKSIIRLLLLAVLLSLACTPMPPLKPDALAVTLYLPVLVGVVGSPPGFVTLPPGSALPSDAACAAAVRSKPENKGVNKTYNATKGNQHLAADFFGGADPRANTEIAVRVDGNFTGTTDEILQWAACKWGIDEDLVRAQAVIESWWHQDVKGDWGTDASRCPPGHGLGQDGKPGQCPESWGLLQNRYPYEQSGWPGFGNSSAFNADIAYAIWRACFEGYQWWLNDVPHGQTYAAGDAWGCVGAWYTGRWHIPEAETYISNVKNTLNSRTWETPNFQEP
jgi:autotransporter family porin